MRTLPMVAILIASAPCFAFLNTSGTWKAQIMDQTKNKPCNVEFSVEQTETRFTVSERNYTCADRYTINQGAINADIQAKDKTVQMLVIGGKVVGVVQENQLQITINHDKGEALLFQRGPSPKMLKMSEMVNISGVLTTLNGLAQK